MSDWWLLLSWNCSNFLLFYPLYYFIHRKVLNVLSCCTFVLSTFISSEHWIICLSVYVYIFKKHHKDTSNFWISLFIETFRYCFTFFSKTSCISLPSRYKLVLHDAMVCEACLATPLRDRFHNTSQSATLPNVVNLCRFSLRDRFHQKLKNFNFTQRLRVRVTDIAPCNTFCLCLSLNLSRNASKHFEQSAKQFKE